MKYWAYVNNEILGPFEKEKLLELPTFSPSLLVCPQTPVGEKTEDWKEAATYPELSALIASGSGLSHASRPQEAATQQHDPAPQKSAPSPEPSAHSFKPLTASSVDPVPPSDHGFQGVNISVNKLGKAHTGQEPAAEMKPQASAFDPISLSTIIRRTETLSEQPHEDGIAKEPTAAFSHPGPEASPQPSAGLEISAITRQNDPPAAEPPAAAPALEQFPSAASEPAPYNPAPAPEAGQPAQPSAGPVADTAALAALVSRLDFMAKAAATRQDIASAVDPLRVKLDQMGEVLSAIKNSQFQREVMDKLNYMENAIADMKSSVKNLQSAPQPAQSAPRAAQPTPAPLAMEKASEVFMGVQAPPKETSKPPAGKETAKPAEIVDQGSKTSKLGPMIKVFKKAFKAIFTIVLLIAVLLGAIIGLKKFGIFDATKFIPFPLPFVGASAEQPAQPAAQPEPQPAQPQQQVPPQGTQQPGEQQAQPQQSQQPQQGQPQQTPQGQPQAAKEPDHTPEVIYFTRTFKLKPTGPSLEDKIYENAAKAGGDYNRTAWKVKLSEEGLYEIAAVIPSKTGELHYTFSVDYAQKSLQPVDDTGKAAYNALMPARSRKKAGRKGAKQSAKQQAQKTAAAAKPAKAAKAGAKGAKAGEDEYEYVYEDDDGTGQ